MKPSSLFTVTEVPLTESTVPCWVSCVSKVPSAFFTTLSLCRCCGRWAFAGFSLPGALSDFPGADSDGDGDGESVADQAMAEPAPVSASATTPASNALRSLNGSRTDMARPPTAHAGHRRPGPSV